MVLGLSRPVWAAADAAALWKSRCAMCHGETGKGDGPAGLALQPPPRDLTDPKFWVGVSRERIKKAITEGRPGTAMVSFANTLSPEEIDALVDYLVTKFKPAAKEP